MIVENRQSRKSADSMIENLSRKITEKAELSILGIRGLGMKTEQIDRHLEDNKGDIYSAVFQSLKRMANSTDDPESAYERLRKRLRKCNLSNYIQVLKPE